MCFYFYDKVEGKGDVFHFQINVMVVLCSCADLVKNGNLSG